MPEGDDVRRGAEEGDELRREQIHRHADQLRDDDGGDDAEARTLLGAVMQTGTEILADKGRQRHGEARDGQESEPLKLGIRAVGGLATLPKELMLDCTMTLAKPMTEFCTPEGRP